MEVFETTFYFMIHDSYDIQSDALLALGHICIRHYKFMLETKLKNLYIDILVESFYSDTHKIKVRKKCVSGEETFQAGIKSDI